jgi:hypothetical protein
VPTDRRRLPVRLRLTLPPWPLLQTGLASLQGVRGWSEGVERKGKSLGGRRAGPAASRSRGSRRAACSLRASLRLRCALRGDPRPSPGGAAAPRPLSPDSPRLGCARTQSCWPLGAARCSIWPEDRRGRKGKAGTHTLAGRARIAHSQPRAPAEARPGRVWPRGFGPGTCPPPARSPGPAPPTLPPLACAAVPSPGKATTSRQLTGCGATGLDRRGS